MHSTASSSKSTHHTQLATIQSLDDNVPLRSGDKNDILRMLRSTVNKEELKAIFPRRTEERPSAQGQQRRFALHPDYAHHLVSVMRRSSDAINSFLQAARAKKMFSYGSSKHYENQAFEKVLLYEWPAPTLAWSFEKRLLRRMATAYKTLNSFLHGTNEVPDLGTLPSVCPTSMKLGRYPVVVPPHHEDALWTGEVSDLVEAALNLTVSENGVERLNIIAPARQQHATPLNDNHLPSPRSPSFSDPKNVRLTGRRKCYNVSQGGSGEFQQFPSQQEPRSRDGLVVPHFSDSKNHTKEVTSTTNELLAPDPLPNLQHVNTRIIDQEPTTRLPRDPDKKPTVFYASSRDDTSCNEPSSFSTPAMPIQGLNTAELSAAQDTSAHSDDRFPPSLMRISSPIATFVEKSHDAITARLASARVPNQHASEPGLPAISKEPVQTVSVIGPLHDPVKLLMFSHEWFCYLKATPTSQNPQVKDQSRISRPRLRLLVDKVANQESAIQPLRDPDKHSTSRYLRSRLNIDNDHPILVHAQEQAIVLPDPDKIPVAIHAMGTCSPLLPRTQRKLRTWHLKPIVQHQINVSASHISLAPDDSNGITKFCPKSCLVNAVRRPEHAMLVLDSNPSALLIRSNAPRPRVSDLVLNGWLSFALGNKEPTIQLRCDPDKCLTLLYLHLQRSPEHQIQKTEDLSDASHSRLTSLAVTQGRQFSNEYLRHPLAHGVTQLPCHGPWPYFSELQHTAKDHLHIDQRPEADSQQEDTQPIAVSQFLPDSAERMAAPLSRTKMKPLTTLKRVEPFLAAAHDFSHLKCSKARMRTSDLTRSPQLLSPWQPQLPSAEKEPDDYSTRVDMKPSPEDSDHLTTTDCFDGKNCDNFSSQWHPDMATDSNGLASFLCALEHNTIAILLFGHLGAPTKSSEITTVRTNPTPTSDMQASILLFRWDSLPSIDDQRSYEPISNSNAPATQHVSTKSIFALLVSLKTTFSNCREESSTRERDKAAAPQAEYEAQALFDAINQSRPCREVSPKSRRNYTDEEPLQIDDSSPRPYDVFKALHASVIQDKMLTTIKTTTWRLPTTTRLTKNSARQGLPDASTSDCQYSKFSDNALNIRYAKDFNSPLWKKRACNQDLPLRASTVTTRRSRPCDIGMPYLQNSKNTRTGSQLTITGVNSHPSPAQDTTESQAESNPQGLQIPSISRHATKPRADTNLLRTEVKMLVS